MWRLFSTTHKKNCRLSILLLFSVFCDKRLNIDIAIVCRDVCIYHLSMLFHAFGNTYIVVENACVNGIRQLALHCVSFRCLRKNIVPKQRHLRHRFVRLCWHSQWTHEFTTLQFQRPYHDYYKQVKLFENALQCGKCLHKW